ncbi:MAG: serine/threonine-protein kinase [Planctomycetaceae bacterium]
MFDYGRTDAGTFYYVMEYLPGSNLEQLVTMHGPMPAARVVYLLTQVCDALAEAHAHGLVHRDIKPANVFAAKRGGAYDVAKLLDFGLVKSSDSRDDVQVTQEGMVAGSPLFMSPEQATGDEPDVRSDIYSLGLVAYYLLTDHRLKTRDLSRCCSRMSATPR